LGERLRIFGSESTPANCADGDLNCLAHHAYGWDERDLDVDVEQRFLRHN
jgi:hypothetical protein